jgi:hypothetical protein
MHFGLRMYRYSLQYIDQIIIGIDVMQLACHEQALHDTDVLSAKLSPAEHPVLAAHRDGA